MSSQLGLHLWCICFCAIPQMPRYDCVFPTDLVRLCSWKFHLCCICFRAIPQITRYDYVFPTELLRLCSWGSIFGAYASALSLRLHATIACFQLICFIVAVGSFIFGVHAFALSLRSHVMSTCSQLSCFVFAVGVPSLVYMLLRYPSDYTL